MKDQQIEALTNTLLFNYDMPEEFAKGLAEFLYDEGCRVVPEGKWNYDGTCSICGSQVLANYTNFCPKCGSYMREDY